MQERRHTVVIIRPDAIVGSKATYERQGFVESPLIKIRMSWSSTINIHIGTSHDQDTRLRLVDDKDLPDHLLAKSDLDHTDSYRTRQNAPGWQAFQQIRLVWICTDQYKRCLKERRHMCLADLLPCSSTISLRSGMCSRPKIGTQDHRYYNWSTRCDG